MTPAPTPSATAAAPVAVGSACAVAGAAVGVTALAVVGAAPIAIGAIIAIPAYLLGHIVTRATQRSHPVVLSGPEAADAETLAALDNLLASIHTAVPATVEARVQRVATTVRQTIPRLDQLGSNSAQAHSVVRTATSYLPEAVAAYMRLPRDFADQRPVSGSKTSLTILCDQLDLLGSKMDDLFDAACRADADALIAHGRFLTEKFASGTLALNPEMRPV